jgi:type VI secretion system secreted protein VgrG
MTPPDAASIKDTIEKLTNLKEPGMVIGAPVHVVAVTPSHLLLGAGKSIGVSADGQVDLTSMKNIDAKAIERLSLLAHSGDLKMLAAKGDVNLEAHSDQIEMVAKEDLKIVSTDGRVEIVGKNEIKLNCGGGAYIILKDDQIELGGSGEVNLRCSSYRQIGPDGVEANLPGFELCEMMLGEAATNGGALVLIK